MKLAPPFVAAVLLLGIGCSSPEEKTSEAASKAPARELRLNDIQMIGTHNSYHIAPVPALFEAERAAVAKFGDAAKGLGDIDSLAYTHASLTEQLDSGIRSFELDVWADPVGGLYANPLAPSVLQVPDVPKPAGLDQPGFKVFHIVDVDFMSTCPTFVQCLTEIRTWSTAHTNHVPIIINVELKDGGLPAPLDLTKVVPIDGPQLDALDAEVRSVFDDDHLLTPDDVRGRADTLRSAVTTTGWPKLDDVRGDVMLFMDNADAKRDTYLEGHPSLKDRVLFTSSGEGQDDGAVLKVNEPGDGSKITELVKAGYLVRTRADADLVEAQTNDTSRRTVTYDSGAQIISTDFPVGEPATSGYVATFGDGPQLRCNAVLTKTCRTADLEPLVTK